LLAFLPRQFLTYSTLYYTNWTVTVLQLHNHANFHRKAHV